MANETSPKPSLNAIRMIREQRETKDKQIRSLFDQRGVIEEQLSQNTTDLKAVGHQFGETPRTHFTHQEFTDQAKRDGYKIVNERGYEAIISTNAKLTSDNIMHRNEILVLRKALLKLKAKKRTAKKK